MDILESINKRHSVRAYLDKEIDKNIINELQKEVDICNELGELHIQLAINEPKAFDSMLAHYGKFSNVKNYIAMIGKKSSKLEEKCGYYGERLVLKAQMLGLNSCWVGLSFKKISDAFIINSDEKLVIVIAIGYGVTQGTAHRLRKPSDFCKDYDTAPEWFKKGLDATILAPTAINQQKFSFELQYDKVIARAKIAFFSKVDLGIVKYHFEIASQKGSDVWV